MQQKNVIIAGSTKCGTTSLFQYMSGHPQMCPSKIKETRFFWDGDYDLPQQKINNKEVKNYSDFFFNCSEDQWNLEATPDYLYSSSTAEKIKSIFPNCRFIFILREPAERIISWFKYTKQLGYLDSGCLPDDYMKLLTEADYSNSPQYLRALQQGKYAEYLQRYIDLFGNKNILITFHKDLKNDPKTFMFTICDFLGIEKSFYDNFDFRIFNPSLNVKSVTHFNKYRQLKKKLRSYNNRLPQWYRNFFKKVLKPLDVVYLKTKSKKWEEISLSSSYQKYLSDYYQQDHELLEKILNKKIPW